MSIRVRLAYNMLSKMRNWLYHNKEELHPLYDATLFFDTN